MPDPTHDCALAAALANRLREERDGLTMRWLERISARVSIDPNRIFPSDGLLDHMPLLIEGIADYLANPSNEITADVPVVAKAMELGELRHSQGFDVYEILKEYELLGGILFSFLVQIVDEVREPCGRGELLACGQRLFRAVSVIQQATATHYLRLARESVEERESRLRAFNLSLSHEFKNRLGAVLGATELLLTPGVLDDTAERERFVALITRNAKEMQGTLGNLLELSRLAGDARTQKHVRLREAVAEVVRQLRDAIAASGVTVRVSDSLPDVDVNAAAVELCLTNYISNALKYSDPSLERQWAEVTGTVEEAPGTGTTDRTTDAGAIVVRVSDNGRGVPEPERAKLFERFFRAHEKTATGVEGTGLGLSIVRDTVASLGGRAWAEFPATGSVFAFSLPYCRDEADTGAPDGACPGLHESIESFAGQSLV